MKFNLRLGWTLAALGAALGAAILLGGCTSMKTAKVARPTAGNFEFKVVEISGLRELTPPETGQLRALVTKFLETHGELKPGSYFVRVEFPPETPEGTPAYVIVQLNTFPTPTSYTLLASYPELWPQHYQSYDYSYNGYGYPDYGYYYPYDYRTGGYYHPTSVRPTPPRQPPPEVAHRRPNEPDNPPPTVPRIARHGDSPEHPRHPPKNVPTADFTPSGNHRPPVPGPGQPERVARTHVPDGEGRHSYSPPVPREHAGGAPSSPPPTPARSTGSERAAQSARAGDSSTPERQQN